VRAEGSFEWRRLGPEWKEPLEVFLRALAEHGDGRRFAPHASDGETLDRVCNHGGADLYYVLVAGRRVLAYGLLRGWDEGYDVPSLGVAVAPDMRGHGLGRLVMSLLHAAARLRGARRVRLRVDPQNAVARHLYESVGYRFETSEGPYLVGLHDLDGDRD
jgi:ribosomal protein S18 acetylase RimI-like enzyme